MDDVFVEQHTIIVTKHCEYRIRPNPDVPEGFDGGAVIEHRAPAEAEWQGYFYIEPSAIGAFADALKSATPGNTESST